MNQYNPGTQQQQSPWPPAERKLDYLFVLLLLAAVVITSLAIALATVGLFPGILELLPALGLPPVGGLTPDVLLLYAGGLFLFAILLFFLARLRIKHNPNFQFINGCPSCKQHDLIRVHRSSVHRILAAVLRMPLRSYACRNCAWNGVLLFYIPSRAVGEVAMMPPQAAATADGHPETVVDPQEIVAAAEIERESGSDYESQPDSGADLKEDDAAERDVHIPPAEPTEQAEQIANAGVEEEFSRESEDIVLGDPENEGIDQTEEHGFAQPSPAPARAAEAIEVEEPENTGEDSTLALSLGSDQSPTKSAEDYADRDGEMSAAAAEKGHIRHSFAADPPWITDLSGGEEGLPRRAVVIAPFGLSMRSAPDKRAEIVMSLEADTVVEILDRDETNSPVSWHRIRHDDQVGWVSAAFLRYLHS